jgi:hypothetical protein
MVSKFGLAVTVFYFFIKFQGSSAQPLNASQIAIDNGLVFNGTCPQFNTSFHGYNDSVIIGTWYMQYGKPNLMEQGQTCIFYNISMENGTLHFVKYAKDIS